MTRIIATANGGSVRVETLCNGCAQWYPVQSESLRAIVANPVLRAMFATFGNRLTIDIEGSYYGPCCESVARKAINARNERIRYSERAKRGHGRNPNR